MGRHVVKQIVNKYIRIHQNDTEQVCEQENFEKYLEKVQNNGAKGLFFSPFHLHSHDLHKQILHCESFRITNKWVYIYANCSELATRFNIYIFYYMLHQVSKQHCNTETAVTIMQL